MKYNCFKAESCFVSLPSALSFIYCGGGLGSECRMEVEMDKVIAIANQCNKMADSQLSQEELELAMQAGQHYRAQRYESCLTTINRLWERRREDPRVLHNKAVARYYLSNLTQTDDFRKTLQQVSEQVLCAARRICGSLSCCVSLASAAC